MTMHAQELMGARVTGTDGEVVGTVEQVFNDDVDGQPVWARVRAGKRTRFVPLGGSTNSAGVLSVPFQAQQIMGGPDITADQHMSAAQAEQLSRYYGLMVPPQPDATQRERMADSPADGGQQAGSRLAGTDSASGVAAGPEAASPETASPETASPETASTGTASPEASRTETASTEPASTEPASTEPASTETASTETASTETGGTGTDRTGTGTAGADAAAGQAQMQPGTDPQPGSGMPAQDWLVRTEERINVDTELRESGRVRIHKYVDVEPVEQAVHVYHEEYEIEHVPITADELINGTIEEGQRELILHEQRAVFRKEAVPVERVRLVPRRVEEDKTIRDELRKERIEIEDLGEAQDGPAASPPAAS